MTARRLRRLGEERADRSVNFRLLRPTLGGVVYDPGALSVRPELGPEVAPVPVPGETSSWSAIHTGSVRFELATRFGRLRVKQFLYDWGPLSALDHAALYDHRPESMRVHALDRRRVAWIGWDYSRSRALSMLAWGTNLELRELEGEHPDRFFLDLAASFRPVSGSIPAPMAERSYWSRWQGYAAHMVREPGYRPPSSFWLWRWPWLDVDHSWSTAPVALVPGPRRPEAEALAPEWRFDSSCVFGESADPDEVQWLFEPASGLGHARLWLRRFSARPGSIRPPAPGEWPLLDRFSGSRLVRCSRLTGSSGLDAFVASRTVRYGPHDLVWWRGRHGYLLQISAAVGHSLDHARALLARLVAERMSPASPAAPATVGAGSDWTG